MKGKLIMSLILIKLISCDSNRHNIDKQYPCNSKLSLKIIEKSERVLLDSNYYIVQINAMESSEYYEPYLLFYNKKQLKLEFTTYNPGKVLNIKDSLVIGYYNENRSGITETKLKNKYRLTFKKKEPNKSNNIKKDSLVLVRINYDTLYFHSRNSNFKNKKVNVKFHINQVVFSNFKVNKLTKFTFQDSLLVYTDYMIDESFVKKKLWQYITK